MRLTTGFILVMTAGLIGCGGGGGSGGANVIPSASLQGTPASTVAPDITTYYYNGYAFERGRRENRSV